MHLKNQDKWQRWKWNDKWAHSIVLITIATVGHGTWITDQLEKLRNKDKEVILLIKTTKKELNTNINRVADSCITLATEKFTALPFEELNSRVDMLSDAVQHMSVKN